MNELQRQRYLSALGIDSFAPRVVLPGAPASQLCELPEYELEEPAPQPAPASTPEPTPQRAAPAAAESVGQVLKDMGTEPARASAPVRPEVPTRREPISQIHLHIWHPASDLMVIDQSDPGQALPTHQLLQNILRVCRGPDYRVDDGHSTHWPMNSQLAEFYTKEDLRVELQAWLATEIQQKTGADIWLMGEAAARYFLPSQTAYNTVCYERTALDLGEHDVPGQPRARVLPSLAELLTDPRLKAHLWKALTQ